MACRRIVHVRPYDHDVYICYSGSALRMSRMRAAQTNRRLPPLTVSCACADSCFVVISNRRAKAKHIELSEASRKIGKSRLREAIKFSMFSKSLYDLSHIIKILEAMY